MLLLVGLISLSLCVSSLRRFAFDRVHANPLKISVQIVLSALVSMCAFYPQSAKKITQILGFGENLNTLIFVGFIICFALIYMLMRSVDTLQKRITLLAQKYTLREDLK